jgi:hypothetical protein
MNPRPMLITDQVRARVAEIKAYAKEHIFDLPELLRRMGPPEMREDLAVGNNSNFCIEIPFGYRCVYSQERQVAGLCAHLSMSVDGDDPTAMPNPVAVEKVLELFGMKPLKEALYVGMEELEEGHKAVNIITLENE